MTAGIASTPAVARLAVLEPDDLHIEVCGPAGGNGISNSTGLATYPPEHQCRVGFGVSEPLGRTRWAASIRAVGICATPGAVRCVAAIDRIPRSTILQVCCPTAPTRDLGRVIGRRLVRAARLGKAVPRGSASCARSCSWTASASVRCPGIAPVHLPQQLPGAGCAVGEVRRRCCVI
jgi:hypothetical protein